MELVDNNGRWQWVASQEDLERWVKYAYVSPEGIIYDEELASIDGMAFTLFPAKHHTKKDIEATKQWLRNSRDVVSISIGKYTGKYPIGKKPPVWTPEQREAGFRRVLTEGFQPVEDCTGVDHFTASYVIQVMDALSPENKQKFLSYPASKMVDITWKLVK